MIKNLIIRRVIILMSVTIAVSSILVAFLGIFLSEGLIADLRSKEFIPDLSIISQCTLHYQNGSITQDVYEDILMNASKEYVKQYIIFDTDKTIIFTTDDSLTPSVEKKINHSLTTVLQGHNVFYKLHTSTKEPTIIVGVPIIRDGDNVGAIFVLADMIDLLPIRRKFIGSIILSIFIVIPFVAGFSYFVLKRIIKPIKNVANMALSMINGDFSIRADETLKGEIGLLGKTMNKLSIDLYKNISQLFIERNRLRQVLNSLDEGMIAVDDNNIITHFNDVFLDMFSFTKEMVQDKCLENITVLNEALHELTQVIEGKYPLIKNSIYNDTIMRIIIAPIENEKNETVGAVILFKDITELERLETMRKDYVANVSHELRSPLTSIRGLIEPLMDSIVTDEEDIKRYYNIIFKESLRLSRLVDDIMELSRLQTNEAHIDKTSIDLSAIIEMVYDRYQLLDDGIQLICHSTLLPKVYSNYDRIEQILVILLDNAYKFTKKGGQIEISTEIRATDILITVKDTGIGITEDDLPFVFDRFYKSDKSRSKRGSGLGLSIAREILAIMGETIQVHSTSGLGSSFEFTLHVENS